MSTNPITAIPAAAPAELGAPGVEDRRLEIELARRLAERYRLEFVDMETFRIDQELFRSIPADLMLRYGFVPYRREGKNLVIVVSDPTDLPMIDELGVLLSTPIKVMVGAPIVHRVDPQEEREQSAGPRGRHRKLSPAAAQGRRERRRKPDRRASDERHQPGHPSGRFNHLHRDSAPRERHPHRDAGRLGPCEVPHRRRAAGSHAADRRSSFTARSSRASRSWPSSTSRRSASRRTDASS